MQLGSEVNLVNMSNFEIELAFENYFKFFCAIYVYYLYIKNTENDVYRSLFTALKSIIKRLTLLRNENDTCYRRCRIYRFSYCG